MAVRRPRLALPFTMLTSPGTVRLVSGEDFRYTLTAPELDEWLPDWLRSFDGRMTLSEAIARLPEGRRDAAERLAERLYGERVLIDGDAADAHEPAVWQIAVDGRAGWSVDWTIPESPNKSRILPVLCQDRLDYDEAVRFNRRCRQTGTPWLWASTGAMSRAYVSPLFLPDAGPCWSCLLHHFHRLSPAPDLYDALMEHARAGRGIAAAPFPPPAAAVLRQLILWKASLTAAADAPAALYRLHVLEVATLEISSHRVFVDPECPECGDQN
jgi:bacteriocin biosynthesis cyclodehydratase domain-containing protein